jgi:predicted CopG family antitoxin
MGSLDHIIFKKKKFSDILSEIYDNQKRKETQITGLISELKPLISDIGDATLIVPLIKEYMEIGVRNDEQLIKMATIVQRALNNSSGEDALGITEEEKQQLIEELDKLNSNFEEKKDGK